MLPSEDRFLVHIDQRNSKIMVLIFNALMGLEAQHLSNVLKRTLRMGNDPGEHAKSVTCSIGAAKLERYGAGLLEVLNA